MAVKSEVTKIFDAYLRETFAPAGRDVVNYLIRHERKSICLDNLCEQIEDCERKTYSITFDAKTYRSSIRDIAKMFASAALQVAQEQQLTAAERQLKIREASKEADTEGMINEMIKDGALVDSSAKAKRIGDDGVTVEAVEDQD